MGKAKRDLSRFVATVAFAKKFFNRRMSSTPDEQIFARTFRFNLDCFAMASWGLRIWTCYDLFVFKCYQTNVLS